MPSIDTDEDSPELPLAVSVLAGTSHCGAGCTLGDILTEWTAVAAPGLATWFGHGTLFRERMFAI